MSRLEWAAVAVTAVVGLGWLTKYEIDKNTASTGPSRTPVFQPPTAKAPFSEPPRVFEPPTGDPVYARIQALTSCADLRAEAAAAAAEADRLRDAGRAVRARAADSRLAWAGSRLARLRCS